MIRRWFAQAWRNTVRAMLYAWLAGKGLAWTALALTIAVNSFWEGARQYGLLP